MKNIFSPNKHFDFKKNFIGGNLNRPTKIFCLACLTNLFAVNANLYAQKVDLSSTKMTTQKVMEEIESKTDYLFVYDKSEINLKQKVSFNTQESQLDDILKTLFANTDIVYKKEGNNIVLMKKNSVKGQNQVTRRITGTILDINGEPIIGANVLIKNTTNGTITDMDGKFSINAASNQTLIVTYIGYQTYEQKIGSKQSISITLKEDSKALEELVVIGYGVQKKTNLTGAVSAVKMEEVLGNRPIGSASKVLESAVPGLQISSSSGKPGSSINMNIRGVTSINNSSAKPLVLVDNIPMDLEMLDPNDIESISILKDASSAAIYGARAAYGVILVETKKGKKNMPMTMSYSNNFSFTSPSTLPEKISPYETVKVYNALGIQDYWAGMNVPKWLGYMEEYEQGKYPEGYVLDQGIRYNLAETDVFDDMFETGFQQNHNLSMSGGGDKAFYRASFGMVDQDGILHSNKDTYKRYNVNAFINMDINKWLSGQIDFKYSKAKNVNSVASKVYSSYDVMPMVPYGYGYVNNDEENDYLPYDTPSNLIDKDGQKNRDITNTRILGRLIIKPFKDLVITGEYSYNEHSGISSADYQIVDIVSKESAVHKTIRTKSYYESSSSQTRTSAINIFANYTKNFNDHHLQAMIGFNQESAHHEGFTGRRDDLIDPNLPSLSLSTGTQYVDDDFHEYALRSAFFRLNYDFQNKYLFEMNGRYDGSSRFAKDNRFGFFPSFSTGWKISEEKFMNSLKPVLNNLKFRLSWGQIGNQNVGYYNHIPIMNPQDASWILPGQDVYVLSMSRPGLISQNYTWEKVESFNIGLDYGLFNNRLTGSFEYYIRKTKDMLAPASAAPSVLGASFPDANSAELRTNGWELNLNWKHRVNNDWAYNIGVNLYDSQSKITSYENSQGILVNGSSLVLREGMKYGEIWGYETDRFYQAADFDAEGNLLPGIPKVQGVTKPNPGDILYKDLDQDGLITPGGNTVDSPGDKRIIGNNSARYQFNINGGVSWKNLNLSFILSGVGKRDLALPNFWSPQGTFVEGVFDWQTDYWTEENTNAYYPRIYSVGGNNSANQRIQSKYLMNGSYIRLKNLSLSYNIPTSVCKKLMLKSLQIYVNGENLYTWHHLPKGYNPDMYTARPGALSLSSSTQSDGTGIWSYPLMRQFSFGLNLTF